MNSTTKDEAPGEAEPSSSTEDLEFTDETLTDKEAEELLEEEEEEEAAKEEPGDEEDEKEKGPSLRERFRQADLVSKLRLPGPAKTGLILVCIFLVALFLRGYFGYGPATEHGVPFLYSGGSDSFYHQRAIEYGLEEHRHLRFDPLLNYPVGFSNPRPPFFDYSAVVFGEMLAPVFFGGDALHAASFVLIWITAVFGALTIFPVYALAKQAFSRRIGLIAALLLAIMPAHIERSVITNADHDSTAIFFMITCFYFFLRALHFMKVEKWVGSWHRPGDIVSGVGRMVRENRMSTLYAFLSGVAFAMVALTWQGYPYLLSVIVFYFFITLLMDKFRGVDPLSVTFITGIALFSGFVIAYPYYYFWGFIGQWYDTPFLIFLIAMAVGFAFCATRDYPWLFVFPAGILVGLGAFFLLSYVNPGFQNTVVSGQGYFFFRSKLYSTIAEAQPAQFSRMAVSFGMGAFLLALWGVAHVAANYRKNPRHDYLFVVAFAIVGMTFTVSQGRFLTNGAPIIAILAAFVVDKIMGIARFEDIRTSYSSMRGTKVRAAVKSVKWKHAVIALGLAFLVVIPSLWFAVDAGIPNEEK
ncbi:MAG TPA: STT3 domain-containing protein, partial [Thermoplasmata archaeon]|nr:STT3 domain-containing protein [Thermoplasmata archaeon]